MNSDLKISKSTEGKNTQHVGGNNIDMTRVDGRREFDNIFLSSWSSRQRMHHEATTAFSLVSYGLAEVLIGVLPGMNVTTRVGWG